MTFSIKVSDSSGSATLADLDIYVASVYDADAEAAFAAMTVQPSGTNKQAISDLFAWLKADGDFAGIELMSFLGSHDQQSAVLDLVNPSRSLVVTGAPTFTPGVGFQRTATSQDLKTPFLSNAMTRYLQNSGSFFLQQRTDANVAWVLGVDTSGGLIGLNINGTATATFRVSSASSATVAISKRFGLFSGSRTDSANQRSYGPDGTEVPAASPSSTLQASAVTLFRIGTTQSTLSAVLGGIFVLSTGKDTAGMARMRARLAAFLTATGTAI